MSAMAKWASSGFGSISILPNTRNCQRSRTDHATQSRERHEESLATRAAAAMGDQTWRRLLDSHDQLARQIVEKHRGSLIKSTGDGILATFDGPARAIRCALTFGTAAKQIGLPLRAGLHTG